MSRVLGDRQALSNLALRIDARHRDRQVSVRCVHHRGTGATTVNWMTLPDYVIQAENSTYRVIKSS